MSTSNLVAWFWMFLRWKKITLCFYINLLRPFGYTCICFILRVQKKEHRAKWKLGLNKNSSESRNWKLGLNKNRSESRNWKSCLNSVTSTQFSALCACFGDKSLTENSKFQSGKIEYLVYRRWWNFRRKVIVLYPWRIPRQYL